MDTKYLLIVTPADGWGTPWYELFHNLENAEKRLKELAEKYGMEVRYSSFNGLKAERYGEFDYHHRIMKVFIEDLYYED